MTVQFDKNGYAYDVSTGQLVNLTYDDQGNAIDQATGNIIDTVITPTGTTYTQASQPSGSSWAGTIQSVASNLLQPASPYGYTTSPYTYSPYSSSPYYSGYRPPTTTLPTSGISTSIGSSGVGLNISPTTLLIAVVVGAAFLFGKRGR